jgi:hypothetical protein
VDGAARRPGGFLEELSIWGRARSELGILLSRGADGDLPSDCWGRGQSGWSREETWGSFLEELRYSESRGDANGGPGYQGADVGTEFNKVL